MLAALDGEKLHPLEYWVNSKFNRHYLFSPTPKYMRGCDIFTAVDAWLINSRNQDSNIPHHLAGSCTWAHTAHFRIHNLSRRNFHFPLECSIVGFSYFHDPQKIHWQKHWELEECPAPAPAPALGMTSRAQKGSVTNPMMHGATESSGDLTPEQTHSFTCGEEDHAISKKLSVLVQ